MLESFYVILFGQFCHLYTENKSDVIVLLLNFQTCAFATCFLRMMPILCRVTMVGWSPSEWNMVQIGQHALDWSVPSHAGKLMGAEEQYSQRLGICACKYYEHNTQILCKNLIKQDVTSDAVNADIWSSNSSHLISKCAIAYTYSIQIAFSRNTVVCLLVLLIYLLSAPLGVKKSEDHITDDELIVFSPTKMNNDGWTLHSINESFNCLKSITHLWRRNVPGYHNHCC